jgi:putative peptidoglycan lipid II flippase
MSTRIALLIYWLALATGTHWPRLALPGQESVPLGLDKWLHFGAFAMLFWLVMGANLFAGMKRWTGRTLSIALVAVYIPMDEFTQPLVPGRHFDSGDLVASYAGLGAGVLLWAFYRWLRRPVASFMDHARVMSGLTLISRAFGLVRDWALAFALGFGAMFDAFAVAFLIPNLFRRLFGEGALAGAFVPQYTRLDQDDKQAARLFARIVLRRLFGVLMIVAIVGACVLFVLSQWTEPFGPRGNLTLALTSLTIWYAPLICGVAIISAVLQVHGRFGVPSAMPIILNIALITAALVGHALLADQPHRITLVLAIAVVVAGLVQLLISKSAMERAGVDLSDVDPKQVQPDTPRIADARRSMSKQWWQVILAMAVFQINTLIDSLIAMFFSGPAHAVQPITGQAYPMEVGSVAVLGAAARLYEFPLGVFGIAVATAIFPVLSRTADDRNAFSNTLRQGLRLTMYIGLPASVGLILLREPICSVIYHSVGAIGADDAGRIAWVLLGYASAIWAYSMNHVLVRSFYAQQSAQTPARVAASLVGLNLVLNLVLIWPLGAAGLAWSTAACQIIQVLILLRLARRYADRPIDATVAGSWLRCLFGSLLMGAAVFGFVMVMPEPDGRWLTNVGLVFGGVAVGAVVYVIVTRSLGMAELRWVTGRRL